MEQNYVTVTPCIAGSIGTKVPQQGSRAELFTLFVYCIAFVIFTKRFTHLPGLMGWGSKPPPHSP